MQSSDCRKYLDLSPEPGSWLHLKKVCQSREYPANKCLHQEVVRRLQDIRESKKEVDSLCQTRSAVDPHFMAKQPKIPPLAHSKQGGQ